MEHFLTREIFISDAYALAGSNKPSYDEIDRSYLRSSVSCLARTQGFGSDTHSTYGAMKGLL